MRFEADCKLPDTVKTVPHVAFEVDDLSRALVGHDILIETNSPSEGVLVAFVLCDGGPVTPCAVAQAAPGPLAAYAHVGQTGGLHGRARR